MDRGKHFTTMCLVGSHVTGGGDARGLAGLPRVAAEALEGVSVAKDSPWEVQGINSRLGPPANSAIARKESKKYPVVKSGKVSVCQGKMTRDTENLLKGKHTQFHL